MGRFSSRDPFALEFADENLLQYLGNSPLTFVDPFGLQPIDANELAKLAAMGQDELTNYLREKGQAWAQAAYQAAKKNAQLRLRVRFSQKALGWRRSSLQRGGGGGRAGIATGSTVTAHAVAAGVFFVSTFGYDLYVSELSELGIALATKIGLCQQFREIFDPDNPSSLLAESMGFTAETEDGTLYNVRVIHANDNCWIVVSHTEERTDWFVWTYEFLPWFDSAATYRETVYDVPLGYCEAPRDARVCCRR